jgi:uncharacterized repeat protein (TIGR03803 family)
MIIRKKIIIPTVGGFIAVVLALLWQHFSYFKVIHTFDHRDHGVARSAPVQGKDGLFYGVMWIGPHLWGPIYKMTSDGDLQYIFPKTSDNVVREVSLDGNMQITIGSDGNLYGTANGSYWFETPGQKYNNRVRSRPGAAGAVFRVTPDGSSFTLLHYFDSFEEGCGGEGVIEGNDGAFYGCLDRGGKGDLGAIFKITTNGAFTILHTFDESDGEFGHSKTLFKGWNRSLYGVVAKDVKRGANVLFKLAYDGGLIAVCSVPEGFGLSGNNIVEDKNGDFYGSVRTWGKGVDTVIKVSTNGVVTTLHHFNPATDGNDPVEIISNGNGILYGVAITGGQQAGGTIFRLTTNGEFTLLHAFAAALNDKIGTIADGASGGEFGLSLPLTQSSDGDLYSATIFSKTYDGSLIRLRTGCGTKPIKSKLPTEGVTNTPTVTAR